MAAVDVSLARGLQPTGIGARTADIHTRHHAFWWLALADSKTAVAEIDRITRDLDRRVRRDGVGNPVLVWRATRAVEVLSAWRLTHVRRIRQGQRRVVAPPARRRHVPSWIDKTYLYQAFRAPAAVRHRMNRKDQA